MPRSRSAPHGPRVRDEGFREGGVCSTGSVWCPQDAPPAEHFTNRGALGKGGEGTVFLFEGKLDRHLYAVKKAVFQFRPDFVIEDPDAAKAIQRRVARETQFLCALTHDNIVR